MWHCPHCGAPQAETARCWVCRRSSTTCSTCRHFRRALAGDLGYCSLDRRRQPLTGLELRGCWEPHADAATADAASSPVPAPAAHRLRGGRARPAPYVPAGNHEPPRGFVPLDAVGPVPSAEPQRTELAPLEVVNPETPPDAPPLFVIEPDERWAERTSLFGDAEP